MCRCNSKPTSLEKNIWRDLLLCKISLSDTSDNISFPLYGYDFTASTLTNVNEWIHEELRVMCYIPHQKGEVLLHFLFFILKSTVCFRHTVVPRICSMGWNTNHSASLGKKNPQLSGKDWIWCLSVPTAVCFWVCVWETQQHRIHLQHNHIHQNSLINDTVALVTSALLLYSSQLSIPEYNTESIYILIQCDCTVTSAEHVSCRKHKRYRWQIWSVKAET